MKESIFKRFIFLCLTPLTYTTRSLLHAGFNLGAEHASHESSIGCQGFRCHKPNSSDGSYEKVDTNGGHLHAGEGEATAPVDGASDGKQAGPTPSGGVKETLSPAMDILVSSNFERLLWYLAYESTASPGSSDSDSKRRKAAGETVNSWMAKVKNDGRVEIPVGALELARRDFLAERVSDEQVCFRRSC